MTTVIYHAQRDGRTAPISFDGVLLRPGSNDLDEGAVVRLLEHPDMGRYIESEIVEFVGVSAESSPAGASPSPASLPRVNVNTATQSDLIALPQIGPATARRLVKHRPFGSLEDARVTSGLSADSWAIVAPWLEV